MILTLSLLLVVVVLVVDVVVVKVVELEAIGRLPTRLILSKPKDKSSPGGQ